MLRTKKGALLGGLVAALLIAAGSIAVAVATGSNGDDNEAAITGDALDRASVAALAHTGAGRVTETEVGDEDSLYEVEVTLDDGSQVDVQLDANFNVVGDEADGSDDVDGDDGE